MKQSTERENGSSDEAEKCPQASTIVQPAVSNSLAEPLSPLSESEARKADLYWAAGITIVVLALFLAIRSSSGAATPILLSFVLAYGLDPAADWLQSKGLSRTLATLVVLLAIAVGIAGFMLYLVPAIRSEVEKLPIFFRAVANEALPRIEKIIGKPIPANIRDAALSLSQQGGGIVENAYPRLAELAMKALQAILFSFALLIVPVLTFYLLHDYDNLISFAKSLIPRKYEAHVSSRFGEINAVLSGFLRGQLTVGAIQTCIYGIGLSIAGLDLAVVIGAVAGFGTIVPYVGPGIGMALAALSLMVGQHGAWEIGIVCVTFVLAMALEGLFITPRIVGGRVGLSAVGVLLAVLIFGDIFGFPGVLLAVPVTAALKVAAKIVITRYKHSKSYRGTA